MTVDSNCRFLRLLAASIAHVIAAIVLFLTLKVINLSQITSTSLWAHMLTWRYPLLLATSSILILFVSRNLTRDRRNLIIRFDTGVYALTPVVVILHSMAPYSGDPQLLFGSLYGGVFILKSVLIGITLLISQRKRPVTASMLFLIMLWFFGFVGLWYGPVHHIHGDEPHYLLMTHSIVHDGDLNLINQYQEKTYLTYRLDELQPKISDIKEPTKIYSRGLGATFPMLLAPAYALGGLPGTQFFIILCSTLLIVQLYLLLMRCVPDSQLALLSVLLIATSNPVLTYSSLIYPDIPAALCIVIALRVLQTHPLSQAGRSVPTWIFLLSAALLFLKFRYFIPVILLMIPVLNRECRKMRNGISLLIALLLLAGTYVIGDRWFLDGDLFSNRFGGIAQIKNYLPGMQSLKVLPGLLLDQESGFMFHAPLYFLIIAGISLYRGPRNSLYWFSVLGIPMTAISLFGHFAWHCLPTPPLRYMLPVLPPTAFLLASALKNWKNRSFVFRTLSAACIVSSWLTAGIHFIMPDWQNNLADGSARFLEALATAIRIPVPLFFPSAIRPGTALWVWLILMIPCLIILTAPFARDARKSPGYFQPSVMITILLGVAVIYCGTMSHAVVRTYHPEDRWWNQPDGGTYFPENRDPFFHQEISYGWQLRSGESLRIPLRIKDTRATGIIRCRLIDSWRPHQLTIKLSDQSTERINVTSKHWTEYAFKIPPDAHLNTIDIASIGKGEHAVAIDSVTIVKRSDALFSLWNNLAALSRRAKCHRFTMACDYRSMLVADGDPWYEVASRFRPGARPRVSRAAEADPLPPGFLNQIFQDAVNAGWDSASHIEKLFQFSFCSELQGESLRDYAINGLLTAHQPAVFLLITLAEKYPDDETIQFYLPIAYYLRGNTYKAVDMLDTLLITGKYYPMQLTKPASHLEVSNPLYSLFSDLENDPEYIEIARMVNNRHLAKSIQCYHNGAIREAALYFDDYYLSDFGIFMESVPDISQEYISTVFGYASRIHTIHVRQLVEEALEAHHPKIAYAAATYGLRMKPKDPELRFGEARALFHERDFIQARQICLENSSLYLDDDRSRWLLEQIMIHMKQEGDRLGGKSDSKPGSRVIS
ncbi:hypothetical protein JW823_02415 [bacterium]|nr:hypothetical protein [candidate division CSSED10-310 bacterium]